MNDTQLQQANALAAKIKEVDNRLKHWRGATRLKNGGPHGGAYVSCVVTVENKTGETYQRTNEEWLDVSPETFVVVKALNVDYWQRELDRLKEEYDQL